MEFSNDFCEVCLKVADRTGKPEHPENSRWIGTVCPGCAKSMDRRARERPERERQARLRALRDSLPAKYQDIADGYGDSAVAAEHCRESIFLWGVTGSGKTVLAVLILREIADQGSAECRFVSCPDFMFGLQSDYENAEKKVRGLMEFPGCLVLDDFGAEKMTDFVRQTYYLLINHREQWELQTIITSNFSLDEIDTLVDRRLSSRINGMCWIAERQGDRRMKKQEAGK